VARRRHTSKFRQPGGVKCEIHRFLGFCRTATALNRRTIFGVGRPYVAYTEDQYFFVSVVFIHSAPIIISIGCVKTTGANNIIL
jgi:hypothetical protein